MSDFKQKLSDLRTSGVELVEQLAALRPADFLLSWPAMLGLTVASFIFMVVVLLAGVVHDDNVYLTEMECYPGMTVAADEGEDKGYNVELVARCDTNNADVKLGHISAREFPISSSGYLKAYTIWQETNDVPIICRHYVSDIFESSGVKCEINEEYSIRF